MRKAVLDREALARGIISPLTGYLVDEQTTLLFAVAR